MSEKWTPKEAIRGQFIAHCNDHNVDIIEADGPYAGVLATAKSLTEIHRKEYGQNCTVIFTDFKSHKSEVI